MFNRENSIWGKVFLALIFCGIFILSGYYLEAAQSWQPIKQELQKLSVATSRLGMRTFREQARMLGLFEIVPNKDADYSPDPNRAILKQSTTLPSRRTRLGAVSYAVQGALKPEDYPSSLLIPRKEIEKGLPIVSIAADNSDLFDLESGIITNPLKKGRQWEKPAFISYYEQGSLRFSSGVGLRIHGGKSRLEPIKSFRLRFRKLYGEGSIDQSLFFANSEVGGHNASGKIKTVILQSDRRFSKSLGEYGHFMAPFAYQLTRDIGGYSPRTKPVRFFLNGEYQGAYVVTERVDKEFLKNHFGHDQFTLGTEKTSKGEERIRHGEKAPYTQFYLWAKQKPLPPLAEIAKQINLENFSLSLIAGLYAGVTDECQAYFVKDNTTATSPWFWINWDMDHGFIDPYNRAKQPWNHETLRTTIHGCGRNSLALRTWLFRRMKRELPEFHQYFTKIFAEVMNHKLRPELLNKRADYYIQLGEDFGLKEKKYPTVFKDFVQNRHPVIFKQVARYFADDKVHLVKINIPEGLSVYIDGHPWQNSYQGRYFTGQNIQLLAPKDFRGEWIINSQERKSCNQEITIVVNADLSIELIPFPETLSANLGECVSTQRLP